jgi:lipopolysaccharide transport system ATP-binding protein
MSDVAIRVENLSKQYRIGGPQARYQTLRDTVMDVAVAPIQRLRRLVQPASTENTIWALKDVSLEVKRGEVLGIIGPNGAGKTTLLKILSRITEPTEGYAEIYGRVGSLLEVGTGFHPELTGRENIYLSGAILGMKRAEIDEKFDEIVQFADIETFLDTPAKRYSSGMYVRLAFAVAAHLEPEVLLVDEVLAVGDAAFQEKCLGKMHDVAKEGRTVLFVSHNMAAIEHLCTSALLLQAGELLLRADARRVVRRYMAETSAGRASSSSASLPAANHRYGVSVERVDVCLVPGQVDQSVTLRCEIDVASERPVRNIGVGMSLRTPYGLLVSTLAPSVTNYVVKRLDGSCTCTIECSEIAKYLAGGDYTVDIWLSIPKIEFLVKVDNAAQIRLPPVDVYGTGAYYTAETHGLVPLPARFDVLEAPSPPDRRPANTRLRTTSSS